MRIELAHCALRPFRRGDEGAIARHADNRAIWLKLRDRFPHPYRGRDAAVWIASQRAIDPPRHLAIEIEGQAAGSIGLEPGQDVMRRGGEVGYWIGEAFWGRGIATEALGAFVAYADRTFRLDRLFAYVFARNPASARVLEKCGFLREGVLKGAIFKDGVVMDAWLYARVVKR
jgi:ribosomal-protein-alanine N-acetyltransferase